MANSTKKLPKPNDREKFDVPDPDGKHKDKDESQSKTINELYARPGNGGS